MGGHARTYLIVMLVTAEALAIGGVGVAIDRYCSRTWRQSAREEAGRMAATLARLSAYDVVTHEYADLQYLVTTYTKNHPDVWYRVIHDSDGAVMADSRWPAHIGTVPDNPVARQAVAAETFLVQPVTDAGSGEALVDVAAPVRLDDQPQKWGTARVGYSLARVEASVHRLRHWLAEVSLVLFAVSTAGTLYGFGDRQKGPQAVPPPLPIGEVIRTSTQAAALARYYMRDVQTEWYLGICVDRQRRLLPDGIYLIRRHLPCPYFHTIPLDGLAAHARRVQADTVITLRYHPHGTPEMTAQRLERFLTFCQEAKAQRLLVRDHLSVDVTGQIFSWREAGQVGHPPADPAALRGFSLHTRRPFATS
jgi:hypothetical protein